MNIWLKLMLHGYASLPGPGIAARHDGATEYRGYQGKAFGYEAQRIVKGSGKIELPGGQYESGKAGQNVQLHGNAEGEFSLLAKFLDEKEQKDQAWARIAFAIFKYGGDRGTITDGSR